MTDFSEPAGEPSLISADSVSWDVFKNPLSLFVGGVAAVILELAEPRVRTGIWDHTSFRSQPLPRLQRTGLAAMITVYGSHSRAQSLIARVNALHRGIAGTTPAGQPYQAANPDLLTWVYATASYGFLEAHHAYARPMAPAERDQYYLEGCRASQLYGAVHAPKSQKQLDRLFQSMRPHLEPSPIVFEFLEIMINAPLVPDPFGRLQPWLIKAAVEIVPPWVRERLGLTERWMLHGWQRALVRQASALADRIPLQCSPAVQACRRLGLADDYLYARQPAAREKAG